MSQNSKLKVHCAIGAMDTLTGLGLIFMPALVLSLMGIRMQNPESLTFIRFVGSFVAATGLCYFLPFLSKSFQFEELIWNWKTTSLLRFSVGLVLSGLILCHFLTWHWSSIIFVDCGVASLQLLWIREGQHD